MAKLEGIIYKAFENFVVFRGYAPIGDLAKVSKRPEAYQRIANDEHKRDIVNFLAKGEYTYFPELVLAYRGANLRELIDSLQGKDDVEYEAEEFVVGLKVLKERVPYSGYRARHAQLTIDNNTLTRVDGNHRLEPFSSEKSWWWPFVEAEIPAGYSEEEIEQWKTQRIAGFKNKIEEIIVPFSVVISNEEIADQFEASIFNNINFKQLPLKQEKNIQNIHKFLTYSEELGKAHKLTIDLINLVETSHFIGLTHLSKQEHEENEVYRTACLKIAKLLIDKKEKLEKEDTKSQKEKTINEIRKKINTAENEISRFQSLLSKEKEKKKIEDIEHRKNGIAKEKERLERSFDIEQRNLQKIEQFLQSAIDINKIEIAIQSLRTTYAIFGEHQGNLSMLAALIYYKLLDESKFNSFVDWIIRNGIHKIPADDYLPTHNAISLIALFERIYEAKRKEVFISMQFGDPQSEMIFEKIVQTIEKYNIRKGYDITITPIRVDQTLKSEMFTISDEIFRAIENSSLIIADLSSRNINVYHEVGYAMGLAQAKGMPSPVILLYKEDTTFNGGMDNDKFIGFNLRGESQLRFKTYKQLMDGVTERLEKHFEV